MFQFLIIVLMVQVFPGMGCRAKCEVGWVEFREHCYNFVQPKNTWFKAKETCNKLGGSLVTIESWSENDWLKLQATAYDNHANRGFYIGITDANSEGTWKWDSNGEKLTIWDFRANEPNGKRGENCVLLHSQGKDANPPYKYHDVACNRKEKYICEKEK